MTRMAKSAWHILLLAVWINISETVRWVLFSKPKFDAVFQDHGQVMPDQPINNILWMVWGVIIACVVYFLSAKFTVIQTTFITWCAVCVTVWIVMWNLAVLPPGLLLVAVPLSLFEIYIAALIAQKLQPRPLMPAA
jgi:hypothetical protein